MRRFFVAAEFREGAEVALAAEEAKHAAKVLRLQVGARVLLVNGSGFEAEGALTQLSPAAGQVRIEAIREARRRVRLELLQAQLKGPKMDWLAEKLTEIGVDTVHILSTERTVAESDRADRWLRIARAALKQSGNSVLPEFRDPEAVGETLAKLPAGAGFLLSPGANLALSHGIAQAKAAGATRVYLAIGPEGGFSPEEEAAFRAAGFVPCQLSHQILRGETAAIAACAIAAHSIDF
jgi:16S rRNA (uracil1498-N3)-methyltransferase